MSVEKPSFMEWWGEVNCIHRDNGQPLPLAVAQWGREYYLKGLTPLEAIKADLEGPNFTDEELAQMQRELDEEFPGGIDMSPIDDPSIPF